MKIVFCRVGQRMGEMQFTDEIEVQMGDQIVEDGYFE
jgi:hypothetical protein